MGTGSWECSSASRKRDRENGVKPEVFREEIYFRAFETLVDVVAETRHELANYRDIIETSERINRPEPKKDAKDSSADGPISRKQGLGLDIARLRLRCLSRKTQKCLTIIDLKEVKCHKKGHYANT